MLVGEKLGRYEIVRMIGAGGMGEVFLAKDSQLGREVALKVLLPEFCLDEDRVKRFMYEARAVSALNHPGIITIHEIVESDQHLFIATEFVDGETVREKIEQKSLDLHQTVSIAEQVADALRVAHDAKIAHRDIKPENIVVRKDGIAKVLDFGLAKPLVAAKSDDEHLLVKTQPGLVIGSVRYMSPEQARGKETDGRTDVWSLGVVLYEMITGTTPFDGETISDQLAALIHADPRPLMGIPHALDAIVKKCLQKEVSERYESVELLAADLRKVRLDIERDAGNTANADLTDTIALPKQNTSENATLIHQTISSDKTTGLNIEGQNPTVESKRSATGRYAPIAAAALLGIFALAGWSAISGWFSSESPTFDSIRVSRLSEDGNSRLAAVSPDGKFVAFAKVRDSLSRLNVRQVATGTEVEIVPEADVMYRQPVFSPDGDFIYYVGVRNGVGTLSRVSAIGGETLEIMTDVDSRPAISPDGKRLAFFRHDPKHGGDKLFVVNSDGGTQSFLTDTAALGVDKLFDLFWSDDGSRITTVGAKLSGQPNIQTRLLTIDATTRSVVEDPAIDLFDKSAWSPAFGFQALKDGSGVIFVGRRSADEALQVWHLDTKNERIRPITTDTSDYGTVSASADGKMIIATKEEWTGGLISYDPVSKQQQQLKPESNKLIGYKGITATSDGRVLVSSRDGAEINIYAIDPTTGIETKLTKGSSYNLQPVSTKKEGTVVFASNRGGSFGIWKMNRDGTEPVQLTEIEGGADITPVLVKNDTAVLFARTMNDGGLSRLMQVSIEGGEVSELLPSKKNSRMYPSVSPDGKTLAFVEVSFDAEKAELTSRIHFADIVGEEFKLTDRSFETTLESAFTWSPSGSSLTRIGPDSGVQLWDYPLDGNDEKQLTSLSAGRIRCFAWSEDGSRLYIVSGVTRSDLVLIRSDAGG